MSDEGAVHDGDQTHPWVECVAHPYETDRDCEYCQKELDGKLTVKDQMAADVMVLEHRFRQAAGISFLGTYPIVQGHKIDVLVDMILQDPKAHMAYELNYFNRLRETMKEAVQQRQRQNLMPGPGVQPKLIIKGQ